MIPDRRAFLRWLSFRVGAAATLWAAGAPLIAAHELGPSSAPALGSPKYRSLLEELRREHGFEAAALTRLFREVRLRSEIAGLFDRPPEQLPLEQYHHRLVTPDLTNRGVSYLRAHRLLFRKIEGAYGVEPGVIAAILGVESAYGRRPDGGYRVIDALNSVFTHVGRREAFARREIIQFLLLCRDERWEPLDIKGSYAGAMGVPQFIPSSYRQYAVDYDKDGVRDLWKSEGDILASVGNFLSVHGWRTGEQIRLHVQVDAQQQRTRELLEQGLRARVRLRDLPTLGGSWSAKPRPSEMDEDVSLLTYAWEDQQRTVAVLPNFRTLLRYNRSVNYALVVADLAELYGGLAGSA